MDYPEYNPEPVEPTESELAAEEAEDDPAWDADEELHNEGSAYEDGLWHWAHDTTAEQDGLR